MLLVRWAALLVIFSQAALSAPATEFVRLDQSGLLSAPMNEAVNEALRQHEMLTGERLFLALPSSGEGIEKRSLLEKWCPDPYQRKSCLVLLYNAAEEESSLEAGVAFEGTLSLDQRELITDDILSPEMRDGAPDEAAALAVFELLRSLNSPLVGSGMAQDLLRKGGFEGAWGPRGRGITVAWDFWLLLGLFLAALSFFILTAAEAHYTAQGWFRPNPWIQLRHSFAKLRSGRATFNGGGSVGQWGGSGD